MSRHISHSFSFQRYKIQCNDENFSKQLIFAILGIVAMLFISKIDYRFYEKFYKHAWVISLILLALVLIAGKTVNGAKRWIYVTETLSFQPSEMVKMLMIIFYAGILVKNRDELHKYSKGFIKNMCLLAPIIINTTSFQCFNSNNRNL